ILERLGVRAFPTLPYPHKTGMAAWLNDWSADFAARHPRVLQSATFFPEPEAAAYVAEALDRGARIFKVHVQVGDFDPRHALPDHSVPLRSPVGRPARAGAGGGLAARGALAERGPAVRSGGLMPGFRLTAAVLDSADPPALARFYSRLLGWPIGSEDTTWVSL